MMDSEAELQERFINNMVDKLEREVFGAQSSTYSDEPKPALTLDALEKAFDAIHPTVYYQTSQWIDKTDKEGHPILFRVKDMEPILIHPDNLGALADLCKSNGYRLKQYDWKSKPHKFKPFIPRDNNGNPL